nr:MAG: RNA-dependent RNA polymerase [Riboviria sp.]
MTLSKQTQIRLRSKLLARQTRAILDTAPVAPKHAYRVYTHVAECESYFTSPRIPMGQIQSGTVDPLTFWINYQFGATDANGIPIQRTQEQLEQRADTINGWIESVFILFKQIRKGKDFEDFYLAVCAFIRAVTGKSIINGFAAVWGKVKDLFHEIVEEISNFVQGDEAPEPLNPFTVFRNWITRVDEVKSHPVVQKCRSMFLYILSFSFLEKFGITFDTFWFTKAEAEYHKEKHNDTYGFFYSVLDGSTFILERLYDCYKTGTWSALTHSSTSYGKWVDEVYALRVDVVKLHNPEANGISYHGFLGRLDNAIEQGRAICRFMVSDDQRAKMTAKKLLSELEMIKATECTKKAARESRDAPFALLYYAGSGVGKSTLQDLTFQHFGKVHNLPTSSEFHYTRIFSDEYYSGFRTSMWSIVLDDVASKHPDMKDDPSMDDILQIMNNVAFTPPQADLADKGKTPLRAALVQASTNSKDLNAFVYYANPLAIQRRLPYVVTVTVKAEYAKLDEHGRVPEPECRMLDSSKTPPLDEGEYPDYWEFLVEKIKAEVDSASKKQRASFVPVMSTDSIHEYLAYISQESLIHKRNQSIVRTSAKQYAQAKVCETCFRIVKQCTCDGIQSTEMMIGSAIVALGGGLVAAGANCFNRRVRPRARTAAADFVMDVLTDTVTELAVRLQDSKPEEAVDTEEFFDTQEAAPEVVEVSYVEEIRATLNSGVLTASEVLQCEHTRVRDIVSQLGQTTQQFRWGGTPVLAFLLAVPTVLAGFKLYSMYQAMSVQGKEEENQREFPKDEKPNPWYREEYTPAAWELGTLTKSWKNISQDQVEERVSRQTMYAEAQYANASGIEVTRAMRILCIEGQMYVTNNHNLPASQIDLTVTPTIVEEGVGQKFTVRLYERDFHRVPESDLVFFIIGCVPPRSDLSGLFCNKTFGTTCGGTFISRDRNGRSFTRKLAALKDSVIVTGELGDMPGFQGNCSEITQAGDCGSPYLGFTPMGPAILGIHIIGGRTAKVGCTRVAQEDITLAKAVLKYRTIHPGKPDLTDADGREIPVGPLHPKSTFRYIESGTANVYGSFQDFRSISKSKVKPTLIHNKMLSLGYKSKVGAPVMRSYVPWRLAHKDIVQQQFVIEQARLDDCVEAFSADIISGLTSEDFGEMKILDDAATLNGLPGVKYIDKMNRGTSMGFPWRHSKRKELIELGMFDIWPDYVEFKPEFYEKVDAMIERYKQGQVTMPVFIEHLKDEVLPLAKVEAQKTRLMLGCPATFAFVVRKYLLSTVRVIQNNRYVFECAPGTNATSVEWCDIYHYLTKHGKDRMVAGDYSKFDKRMSAQMITAAFKVLYNILRHAGWSEENLTTIWTIGGDIAFPLVDANGDLVQFWGSNPSGHPLTVIINSLVNSLYVRYAWSLKGNDLKQFKSHVALMTYGDDNIMGISRKIKNFDHTVLQTELAKIGVVYTMADKEAESVPFLHIEETSFLKRRWVYNADVGSHVAQLEHDSIEKGLMYHIPSKVVCAEQQAVNVMGNALREYFFYGEETYNTRKVQFEQVIKEMDLGDYFPGFVTYDDCVRTYLEGSSDIHPGGLCPECCP